MKYKTIVIDSGAELMRLYFSWEMKKSGTDMDTIRSMQNYPGATERFNILIRRLKDYRSQGLNVVITSHESIDKIYAKGGMMGEKGQRGESEAAAIKGWPDFPGKRAPDEVCRAADNVFRVRTINGKVCWMCKREAIPGGGDAYWEVKDRFGGLFINPLGILPGNYPELEAAAKLKCPAWNPPYIYVVYGPFGIGKTRSLLGFPRPIKIFDLDRGTASIHKEVEESNGEIEVVEFNPEDFNEYNRFTGEMEATLL